MEIKFKKVIFFSDNEVHHKVHSKRRRRLEHPQLVRLFLLFSSYITKISFVVQYNMSYGTFMVDGLN